MKTPPSLARILALAFLSAVSSADVIYVDATGNGTYWPGAAIECSGVDRMAGMLTSLALVLGACPLF